MENIFGRNVVVSWAEYVQETVEASDILSQSLWNNVFIKIENKSVFYKSWYIKNSCYVNELVDESGVFMSLTELINKFNLKCTFLQAYDPLSALFQARGSQRLECLVNDYLWLNLKI